MADYRLQVGDTLIDVTSSSLSTGVYNVTVDVIRNTKITGAMGISKTPVIIVNDMPCDIKWTSGRERMFFKKNTHFLDGILRCRVPTGVTIIESDVVQYNSENYEVVDVQDVRNLGKLLIIGLRKVT